MLASPPLTRYPPEMAKQCPSNLPSARAWERRIFKNTYVRNGQTREVRGWAVRLQWQGARKTFSLVPMGRRAAAAQARKIYDALLTQGWEAAINLHRSLRFPEAAPGRTNGENGLKEQPLYWNQRLMRRKYTEQLQPDGKRALSVRIGDESNQYYWFPLRTDSESEGATRALGIYRTLQAEGWK